MAVVNYIIGILWMFAFMTSLLYGDPNHDYLILGVLFGIVAKLDEIRHDA